MSLPVVKQIILQAITDPVFRRRFLSDTERTLAAYHLTEEERECLRMSANERGLEELGADFGDVTLTANDIRI